ncbi:MAG: DUF6515 family protein [Candidatus Kryptoniota bacterium]
MRQMNEVQSKIKYVAVLLTIVVVSSLFVSSGANAQRRRVAAQRERASRVINLPRNHYTVFVGRRNYFYSGGYFYRRARRGYVSVLPPIGARIRVLPVGFVSFRIGPLAYYYWGGAYYQYMPDENVYVVVNRPNGAPNSSASNTSSESQDEAVLTNGTTLSGVFMGASADSVQFQVNGEIRSIPITGVSSITFAPSAFDTTSEK